MGGKDSALDWITRELQRLNISYSVSLGRHAKVHFHCGGEPRTFVCTRNVNGGRRTAENSLAGLRRLLRQCGALDPAGRAGIKCKGRGRNRRNGETS
jgi:hypothetical protein